MDVLDPTENVLYLTVRFQKHFLAVLHNVFSFMSIKIDIFVRTSIGKPGSFQSPAHCATVGESWSWTRRIWIDNILKGFINCAVCAHIENRDILC
jgi:hypothetical protein